MGSTFAIVIACALSCTVSTALAHSGVEQLATTLSARASPEPLPAICGFLALGLCVALTLRRKR